MESTHFYLMGQIVGLFAQTPRNFPRGRSARGCLGMRDPRCTGAANSAVAAESSSISNDEGARALSRANGFNFAGVIGRHIPFAVGGLGDSASLADELNGIVADDKQTKCSRIALKLREAAVDVFQ